MLRAISGVSLVLLLAGCAHSSVYQTAEKQRVAIQNGKNVNSKVDKKHPEPCPCSPTANQVVSKRWYDGFKVRWFH